MRVWKKDRIKLYFKVLENKSTPEQAVPIEGRRMIVLQYSAQVLY